MSSYNCPSCGFEMSDWKSLSDRNRRITAAKFDYKRCGSCGLIELPSVPENLGEYYPSDYYVIPSSRAELVAQSKLHEDYKLEIVKRFSSGGELLEIGPATGGFSALAQDAGFAVTAVEMNPDCCVFLRSTVGIKTIESADSVSVLQESKGWDVIALWHVIEHLPNPFELLSSAAAKLRPGGILVFASPNPDSLQLKLLGSHWTHLDAPRHLCLIPISVVESFATRNGLSVEYVTTSDPGAVGWNVFGWIESLGNLTQSRPVGRVLRFAALVLNKLLGPVERSGTRGSAYTIVLRSPE